MLDDEGSLWCIMFGVRDIRVMEDLKWSWKCRTVLIVVPVYMIAKVFDRAMDFRSGVDVPRTSLVCCAIFLLDLKSNSMIAKVSLTTLLKL